MGKWRKDVTTKELLERLIETNGTYQELAVAYGMSREAVMARIRRAKVQYPTLYAKVKELPRVPGRRGKTRKV